MQQLHELSRFTETMRAGLAAGATMRTATTMEWNIAGRCANPAVRILTGRSRPEGVSPWQNSIRYWQGTRRDIELTVRCGKCPPCLRRRSAYWRQRSEAEISQTLGRTWFVTLTVSPEHQFQALLGASLRLAAQGVDFEQLSEAEQFKERHRELGREITKWLKRVRKEAGVSLRYILVAEPHTGKNGRGSGANLGLPHYHLLVHESDADAPLRARILREQWKLGFSTAKLVAQEDERRHAAYVAKYLSKSASARVRASQGYGHAPKLPQSQVNEKNVKPLLTPPPNHDDLRVIVAELQLSLFGLGPLCPNTEEPTVGYLDLRPLSRTTKRNAPGRSGRLKATRASPLSPYVWGTEQ